MMKNRLCGRRPVGLTQFLSRRELGLCGTYASSPADISLQLAEEKATLPVKNQSCELSGQSRSTFLMAFSPDGKKIASTHGDHTVRVTIIKTGQCTHILTGHPRTPWCLAFHPSSNDILASGCLGGEVRIWDLRGGGSEVWKSDKGFVIASITFHPVEHVLVIATTNELLFWDWTRPEPFARCKTAYEYERVRWVKFDPWGHHLYTGIANSSTIQREDLPREGVGHSTADPSSHEERRRLRQRYRNIVQQITSHQRDRILGSQNESASNPFLAPSNNSEGLAYSGPHQADLEIVEPRSPTRSDALESALSYGGSNASLNSSTPLSRARQYAANVTSASLLGAGEHVERAVVRVRNEHAIENDDSPEGEAASNVESHHPDSRSTSWDILNNNRPGSVSGGSAVHTVSSTSVSASEESLENPGSSQASGVTLPVSLGLTMFLPPPVGSQEIPSGSTFLPNAVQAPINNPVDSPRIPPLPSRDVESRPLFGIPPVSSSTLNLGSGTSFDLDTTLPSIPNVEDSETESRSRTLLDPVALTTPAPFLFLPDQVTEPSLIDYPLSDSTFSLSSSPLSRAFPDTPLAPSSHTTSASSSRISTTPRGSTSITGHGASGLTLLANAGLALERQQLANRDNISFSSDTLPTSPVNTRPRPVTVPSNSFTALSSTSVAQPVYITTSSAPVTTPVHSSLSGSHSPRPSLLRSQLELLQAQAPRVPEVTSESPVGHQSGESLDGAMNLSVPHADDVVPSIESSTRPVEQPRRLASLIESEVRLAIERVRARQVDIRETLNALDQLQADVSDSVSSTDTTPSTSTMSNSSIPSSLANESSYSGTNPLMASSTSNSSSAVTLSENALETSDVPASVGELSAELSRRLEHLNQLDERVNQITARLGDRMRSLAVDRQRDLQRLQLSRQATAARHRSSASERILQRQERLRAHLNDIRRRYLTAREREWAIDRNRRPGRGVVDLPDDISASAIINEDEPDTSRLPFPDAERELRGLHEGTGHSITSRPDRYGPLDARYMRHRHRQLHQEIQSMRAELANRRRQQREHERTWHTLQRRHLHPHYAVSILDDTINRENDGLQAAINRAIAGVFMGNGESAVANNIVNLTHRIQCWDFRQSNVPDISQSETGIVVPHCKLHNDASCEISTNGELLMTFVPSHRGFPDDTILGVFSLRPESFGQCLYTKSFGPNAISVSLSPLGCYVLVGLAAKRLAWVFTPKQMVAQIFQLKTPHAGEDSMEHICDLMHPCEVDLRSHVSVNSARWLPGVGQGVVYGTNRGDLHICRPGDEDHEPRDRGNRGGNNSGADSNPMWHQRRNLMQLLGLTVPRTASTATQTTQRIRRTASTQTDRITFD